MLNNATGKNEVRFYFEETDEWRMLNFVKKNCKNIAGVHYGEFNQPGIMMYMVVMVFDAPKEEPTLGDILRTKRS